MSLCAATWTDEKLRPPPGMPTPMPPITDLVLGDPLNVETVLFADPLHNPVRVVRGPHPGDAPKSEDTGGLPTPAAIPAPRREIVSFGSAFADQVIVVRGPEPSALARIIPSGVHTSIERVAFKDPRQAAVSVIRGDAGAVAVDHPTDGLFDAADAGELDRVAFAVDGVESRHGADLRMWRPEAEGPQGPMQVSAAAALDVGGGDRFDVQQNRLLGRAYLAQMFRRYGNWADAIAAYNWGPGNMDQWIGGGRNTDRLPIGVVRYTNRVLRDALVTRAASL